MTWHIFSKRNSKSIVGSVVEWLMRDAYDQHDLGSKPTHAFRCVFEKHTLRHFPLHGDLGKQF